jgi:nucleotide-binding universal stress UspA family protein
MPRPSSPLLLAYDGSEHAAEAIRAAARLLAPRPAIVLTVWSSVRATAAAARLALPDTVIAEGVAGLDAEASAEARRTAEAGARVAAELGPRAEPLAAECAPDVAATISAVAGERDAAVVALGFRGRSTLRVLGGTAYSVLHGRRPVLVARAGDGPVGEGPIVLCDDGSAPARHALVVAAGLVAPAPALVAHAWRFSDDELVRQALRPRLAPQVARLMGELEAAEEADAAALAAAGAEAARAAGLAAAPRPVAADAGTWQALAELAEHEDARLVVAGSRGRSRLRELVVGSVVHALLHDVRAPLLLVPPDTV